MKSRDISENYTSEQNLISVWRHGCGLVLANTQCFAHCKVYLFVFLVHRSHQWTDFDYLLACVI